MKLKHKRNQGGISMSFTTKMTEQFIQNMYQKTTNVTKYTKNKAASKTGAQQKVVEEAATYEKSASQTGKATYTKPVAVGQKNDKKDELQAKLDKTYESLSTEAKTYLETLKEKYGDIQFFVADCATDEEMNQYFAMGTKKYSCVISTDTLEQMATDEEVRAKYENIIDNADEQIEEMKEQIEEEVGEEKAEQVQFVGFSIDDNGVVNYFAKLKDSNDSYYEKLAEKRAEEKKEAKEAEKLDKEKELEEKRLEEQKELPKQEEFWIKADSKEGLIAAIKEALGIEEVKEEDQEITMTKVTATE